MRIAPKPTGKIMTIEELLGGGPSKEEPKPKLPMNMERFDTGWVFSPVNTLSGPMKIWLSACAEQNRMRREVEPNGVGQRLITADEFYGVLEWIYDFHKFYRPQDGAPVELKAWIAHLWEKIPQAPFLVNTSARYVNSRKLEVTYKPGMPDQSKITTDIRESTPLFDHGHFGAQDKERFQKVWEYTSASPVELHQPGSPYEILGAELNFYLFPRYVSMTRDHLEGMVLMVKATPVKT